MTGQVCHFCCRVRARCAGKAGAAALAGYVREQRSIESLH